MKVGILTGGGDCPGLNAAIRAVAKRGLLEYGWEVYGVLDGYDGLLAGGDRIRPLTYMDVSGILHQGGTILGTSNRGDPFDYPDPADPQQRRDLSDRALANLKAAGIEALVAIGGDGTMAITHKFALRGLPVVGVPKTIDNDFEGTDVTFGFATAVSIATEALDRLHTTAMSHHRIMILEVMGRNTGWIALHAGVAGGADVILIPELPYSLEAVQEAIQARTQRGSRFTILVVAEGVLAPGGGQVVREIIPCAAETIRLGGIGALLKGELEECCGIEVRSTVLGHLQRGGSPCAADRLLATRYGTEAAAMVQRGEFSRAVVLQGGQLGSIQLERAAGKQRRVPANDSMVQAARAVGTCFGSG